MRKVSDRSVRRTPGCRLLPCVCAALLAAVCITQPASLSAQDDPQDGAVFERPDWAQKPVQPRLIRKRIIDLPPPTAPSMAKRPTEVNPLRKIKPLIRPEAPPPKVDPVLSPPLRTLQKSDSVFSTPRFTVQGIGHTLATPPDTMGEVGTTHYLQSVNGFGGAAAVEVFSKADGSSIASFDMKDLAPAGDLCETSVAGDGVILFDQLAKRWILLEFVRNGSGNRLCFYLSTGEDPLTSFWSFVAFNTPNFPDYPKVGVWPDAYYISTNEHESGVAKPSTYVLDRASWLAGQPVQVITCSVAPLAAFAFQTLTPADLDGTTPPPEGAPGIFMRHRDDEAHNPPGTPGDSLELWEARVDFQNPGNSSFDGPIQIPIADFDSNLCGLTSRDCIPQYGVAQRLDSVKEIIMWRLSYRNFESHEMLLGNFTVDINGSDVAGIRWFELRRSPPGIGDWTLYQEGTLGSAESHRWMGSIAMDGQGNIALGYSRSSSGLVPEIAYTGRRADAPLGTMSEVELIADSSDFPQESSPRWGDYAAMTVDPIDDFTFWFTTEKIFFFSPYAQGLWTTRITSFSFDPLLFSDGFESGDALAWARTVKSQPVDFQGALPGPDAASEIE